MGGLHGTGSSARHHQESLLGEPLAQADYLGVCLIGPPQAVPAHDAYHVAFVVVREELVHAVADAVVVHRAGQCLLDVLGTLALLQIVAIHAAVEALLVCFGLPHLVTLV